MASIYKHTRGKTPYWIGVFRDQQENRGTAARGRKIAARHWKPANAGSVKPTNWARLGDFKTKDS